jgi:hypothetical protein
MSRRALAACVAAACLLGAMFCSAAHAATDEVPPVPKAEPHAGILDAGFRKLYELNFQGAREEFLSYQHLQPQDPLGKAAEAASYLYEQFNAEGVFTSEFFLNNAKFLGGVDGSASANRNDAFLGANRRAREMAKQRLKSDPRDPQGLMVLTLADGMESDYDALIVKKQLAGLGLMRQAESEAARLLEVDPSAQDAYVALGASNYIIGCLPSYKRAFLWFDGVHGDRARGMQQMQVAAEHGHYLAPFAKILLALACEREHDFDHAQRLLTELTNEFPTNPIFAHELDLLQHRTVGAE